MSENTDGMTSEQNLGCHRNANIGSTSAKWAHHTDNILAMQHQKNNPDDIEFTLIKTPIQQESSQHRSMRCRENFLKKETIAVSGMRLMLLCTNTKHSVVHAVFSWCD